MSRLIKAALAGIFGLALIYRLSTGGNRRGTWGPGRGSAEPELSFTGRSDHCVIQCPGTLTLTHDQTEYSMSSINPTREVRLSVHARQRMDEMMLEDDEVIATVNDPEYTYPLNDERGGLMMVRGRLAVPVGDNDPEVPLVIRTVMWALAESREHGPIRRPLDMDTKQSVVPARPSNRNFYNKLVLWGFKLDSQQKDKWKMKRGTDVLEINPPKLNVGPSQTTFHEAYKMLGVTDEEFWGRTTPVPKPKPEPIVSKSAPKPKLTLPPSLDEPEKPVETKPVEKPAEGVMVVDLETPGRKVTSPRTLALLSVLPSDGSPISLAEIVEKTGMSRRDMGNAAEGLHRTSGYVERYAPATYRFKQPTKIVPPLPSLAELQAAVAGEDRTEDKPVAGKPFTLDLSRIQTQTREFLSHVPADGTPIAATKLVTLTGMDRKAVYNAIDRLVRSGKLVKHAPGLYGFPGPVTFVGGEVPPTHVKPDVSANGVEAEDDVRSTVPDVGPSQEELAREDAERRDAIIAERERKADAAVARAEVAPAVVPEPKVEVTAVPAVEAPKPVEATAPKPVKAVASTSQVDEDPEVVIDAVFDVLFPEGLMVHSSDFAAIAAWREHTRALLELRRGS